jgi:hypothetical protein
VNWQRVWSGIRDGLIVVALLTIVLLASVVYGMREEVRSTLQNVAATTGTIKDFVAEVKRDYRDGESGFYWDVAAMLSSVTAQARTSEEATEDVRAVLVGGRDSRGKQQSGVLPGMTELLSEMRSTTETMGVDLRSLIKASEKDLTQVTTDSEDVLIPMAATMRNIQDATFELDQSVKDGGDVKVAMKKLEKTVDDFDQLLDNENIQKILASSADTSQHLAESAKSLDIAMAPWRKKANQLKEILLKVLGMVKLTYGL